MVSIEERLNDELVCSRGLMVVDYPAINRWYKESFEEGWMESSGEGSHHRLLEDDALEQGVLGELEVESHRQPQRMEGGCGPPKLRGEIGDLTLAIHLLEWDSLESVGE